MNKKFTTLLIACFTLFSTANAQQYNLFNPADVDADGWLWFDTQAKIDKYVGQANNADYTIDPNGKIIQLIDANYGEFESSQVDATFVGVGTDKELGGANAKTGALILAKSSKMMNTDGGGFVVNMPSCTSFSLFLSSESSMLVRLLGTTDNSKVFTDYSVVSAKYVTSFNPLSSAGQFTWTKMETLDSGFSPFFNLTSSTPISARLENCRNYPLYIHGIKIMTSTQGASIGGESMNSSITFDGKAVSINEPATINVYNVAGTLVASEYTNSMSLSNLTKGIYIVKANQETAKIAIR